jgi:hypothetical protein
MTHRYDCSKTRGGAGAGRRKYQPHEHDRSHERKRHKFLLLMNVLLTVSTLSWGIDQARATGLPLKYKGKGNLLRIQRATNPTFTAGLVTNTAGRTSPRFRSTTCARGSAFYFRV